MNSIDIEEAIVDISNAFDHADYPKEFLENYVQLECLACGHGTETFLVKGKDTGELFVAKCYDKEVYSYVHESGILKPLHHEGLPAFADEFENDKMACIVREYVEGTPLDQFVAVNDPEKKDILGICTQLCDILIYLHGQDEPVIHRDIKPQNVIVKPNGKISLIDFDISRVYRAGAKTDTQFLGTREYAPPEQYGFSQTDCRADLYSMGVLLGWLLTREIAPKEVALKLGRDPVVKVYQKCTAFSPEDRFASAAKLKSALISLDGRRRKGVLRWMAAALSCVVLLGTGFFIGRYTDFLVAVLDPRVGVAFDEPLIERAVRLQLGKAPDAVISEDDLLTVTKLFIFGDSLIATVEDGYNAEIGRLLESNGVSKGPIRTIADLARMPNLTHVSIAMQEIADISPLAGLKNLEYVDLRNNPVTDLSSLGEMQFLKRLCLFDTRVTDFSPIKNCPMLAEIDAGHLPIRSPAVFAGFRNLQSLSLYATTIDTLAGIEDLAQLRSFEVSGVIDGDLTPLLRLPYLRKVVLGEDMQPTAKSIQDEARFEISYGRGS